MRGIESKLNDGSGSKCISVREKDNINKNKNEKWKIVCFMMYSHWNNIMVHWVIKKKTKWYIYLYLNSIQSKSDEICFHLTDELSAELRVKYFFTKNLSPLVQFNHTRHKQDENKRSKTCDVIVTMWPNLASPLSIEKQNVRDQARLWPCAVLEVHLHKAHFIFFVFFPSRLRVLIYKNNCMKK